MGCDEHFYLEVKRSGKWIAEAKVPNKYPEEENDALKTPEFNLTGGRNYHAYAILADVRNGRGFAGIDTGDPFRIIHEPKGLPADVTPDVKHLANQWGIDGHSHTWLTLRELREFDWWQMSTLRGVLDVVTFAKWRTYARENGNSPSEYCGAISGPSITIVDMEQAEVVFEAFLKQDPDLYWAYVRQDPDCTWKPPFTNVHCHWAQPYTEAAGYLYTRGIPTLQRIAHDLQLSEDDVRVVGWFDN